LKTRQGATKAASERKRREVLMAQFMCCDNPSVTFVREVPTADGGKKEYHKCLSCQTDHIITKSKDGRILSHETSA
jgi:hypothetical protein